MKVLGKNRSGRRNYTAVDKWIAGISLDGAEVKSIRRGQVKLDGSYCQVSQKGIIIVGMYVAAYQKPVSDNHAYRTRNLLLNKSEIDKIIRAKDSGMQIVPLAIGLQGRYIKLEIASAKSIKKYDKRHKINARQDAREQRRAMEKY